MGITDKMVNGVDLFLCLHRAPVSWGRKVSKQEITTSTEIFQRGQGQHHLWGILLVLGRLPWEWLRLGAGQEAPASLLLSSLLPSPFPPSILLVFWD